MTLIKINNVYIQLINWYEDELWNLTNWKVNQFLSFDILNNITNIIGCKKTIDYSNISDTKKCQLVISESFGFFDWKMYKYNDGQMLFTLVRRNKEIVYLQYIVNKQWNRITLVKDRTNSSGVVSFEYLGKIMSIVFLYNGILSFHGVLMEYEGKGIIISASSGTGKTTHARLWRDSKNALIINGDKAVCQKIDGVWTGIGVPWSGTSGEQINRSVPIVALVVLERANYNKAFRIREMEAFGAVLPHVQCPTWDKELSETVMDLLDDFLNHIPVIRLQCLPDLESVEVLSQVLEDL